MSNFEKITFSAGVLSDFLRALPVIEGPWDDEFNRTFCAGCPAKNCDTGNCPHETQRNNLEWWLSLEARG